MEYVIMALDFAAVYYICYLMASYIAYSLAGRRMPYRRILLLQIPPVLIMGALYQTLKSIYIAIPDPQSFEFYHMIFFALEIVCQTLWIYFLFRDTDKKKRFFYASTIFPFGFLSSSILMMLLSSAHSTITIKGSGLYEGIFRALISIAAASLVIGMTIAAVRFASKTKFWSKLQDFGGYPKLYIPMGTIYFLFYIIVGAFGSRFTAAPWLVLIISLAYLVLLAVAVIIVSDLKRTEKLNAARSLLLQQQNYIHKLESIQREIRSIQHDYKNMLAGLYAQASEGNIKAVKEYIDTKLLKVDETVRDELMQMNQLACIEIPELKGLIMTKMLEAERDQVPFRLEVMFPVSRASMATEDLLRCVGILLDNAIEEARTQKDAVVTLVLLQEDAKLTVVVKNPVQVKPDLVRIQNESYSTKGSGRGVGLFNYQNLIRKYPYATQETKIDGEHFVQVLVLAGNR